MRVVIAFALAATSVGALAGEWWMFRRYGFGTARGLIASVPFGVIGVACALVAAFRIGWL